MHIDKNKSSQHFKEKQDYDSQETNTTFECECTSTMRMAVTMLFRTCGQTPLPVLCSAHIVCNILSN